MHIKDQNKLESILEAIEKIEFYTRGFSNANDFKITHPKINWINIQGLRNIVAHNYFGIDAEKVWQIIQNKLSELKGFIEENLQSQGKDFLQQRQKP